MPDASRKRSWACIVRNALHNALKGISVPSHVTPPPPLIVNAQRLSGAGSRGVERLRRSRSKREAISLKDLAGSSRRTALLSKPVARNLVEIDCSRCEAVRQVQRSRSGGMKALNQTSASRSNTSTQITGCLPDDVERAGQRLGLPPTRGDGMPTQGRLFSRCLDRRSSMPAGPCLCAVPTHVRP